VSENLEEPAELGVQEPDSETPADVEETYQEGASHDQQDDETVLGDTSELPVEYSDFQDVQDDRQDAPEHELEYITNRRINDENQAEAREDLDPGGIHQGNPVDEEGTEYEDYTETHGEGDDEYNENFQGNGAEPIAGHIESEVMHNSSGTISPQSRLEPATPHQIESVITPEDGANQNIGNGA
jgi:hypothetical protein